MLKHYLTIKLRTQETEHFGRNVYATFIFYDLKKTEELYDKLCRCAEILESEEKGKR
jgi:hypothetical protein